MKKQKALVLLDYGHGGVDYTGTYYCIAGGKLFKHPDGMIYEGVLNRTLGAAVEKQLDKLGIDYIVISDSLIDLPLKIRVRKANGHYLKNRKSFLVSLHCNASIRHNAQGYEVYTSPGQTASDKLAEYHYNFVTALLDNRVKMRSEMFTDGDRDKEAKFYILTRTYCPAILIEHLFFDHPEDVKLLQDKDIIKAFAESTAYACKAFIEHQDALNDDD